MAQCGLYSPTSDLFRPMGWRRHRPKRILCWLLMIVLVIGRQDNACSSNVLPIKGTNKINSWPEINMHLNNIFSGYKPCQLIKRHRRFRDHLCPHRQGSYDGDRDVIMITAQMMGTEMVPETSVILNRLTQYYTVTGSTELKWFTLFRMFPPASGKVNSSHFNRKDRFSLLVFLIPK
jgi:hypothetical protein